MASSAAAGGCGRMATTSEQLEEAFRVIIMLVILYVALRAFAPIIGYPWPLP